MVAVFVKLSTNRNKKMARSTRGRIPKLYGKGKASDQPRKAMEPESAAEKKANDKLYKRKQDFYAPVKLPFSK